MELVFIKGHQPMALNKRVSVSNCPSGGKLDVRSSLKIPNQRGRYVSYYRLYSGDVPFGPLLCAEIVAVDKGQSPKSKKSGHGVGGKGKGRRLSMVLSKDIPSVSCLCGEYLMPTRPLAIYGSAAMVFCRVCGARCSSTSTIYHCAMDRNEVHPDGYDLCSECYGVQLMGAFDPNNGLGGYGGIYSMYFCDSLFFEDVCC